MQCLKTLAETLNKSKWLAEYEAEFKDKAPDAIEARCVYENADICVSKFTVKKGTKTHHIMYVQKLRMGRCFETERTMGTK